MSSEAITRQIQKDYSGHGPSAREIRRYVNDYGLVGLSPIGTGTKETIARWVFNTLCSGLETYTQIKKINGRDGDLTRLKLLAIVDKTMGNDPTETLSYKLINRIMRATDIDLKSGKCDSVEERRVLWTTFCNIKTWFENWKVDFVEIGFTEEYEDGSIRIWEEKLKDICNLDETCISLDEINGNRGGRLAAVFFDPRLLHSQKTTSKTLMTTTMMGGRTDEGNALPPKIQFQTKAQSYETQRICNEMAEWLPDVRGKFGCDKENTWPVTIGMNEKGGMDDAEFEKYLFGSMDPLYPNEMSVKGKWVIIMLIADQ